MNSAEIVEAYGAKLDGQQLLFHDDDIVLRQTKFNSITPEFDKQALIHWWMDVYLPEYRNVDEHAIQEVYNSWSNAIWNYFKYTSLSGYNPATNQQVVKFSGYLKEPVDVQTEELRLWVPHIKLCLNKDNGKMGKYISIFEHSLSANGIYSLWIYDNDDIGLGCTRYSHYEEKAHFDCLGKAVWFVVNHYWYEKKLRR